MKEYLRWIARLLYLLVFWPSRFRAHVDELEADEGALTTGQRFIHLLKLTPLNALVGFLSFVPVWLACRVVHLSCPWVAAALAVTLASAIGMIWEGRKHVSAGFSLALTEAAVLGSMMPSATLAKEIVGRNAIGMVLGAGMGAGYGLGLAIAMSVTRSGPFRVPRELPLTVGFGVAITTGWFGIRHGLEFSVVLGVSFAIGCIASSLRLLTYPVDALLTYLAWRRVRQGPEFAHSAWRLFPVSWNEMLWMPLPFATQLMVALTRHNRDQGIERITFVAGKRSLQRRTAVAALSEVLIDDLQAKSLSEIIRAGEKSGQAGLEQEWLLAGLAPALNAFSKVSAYVAQSAMVQSAFRRRQLLQRAQSELEALQKELVATSLQQAPALLRHASEWKRILDSELAHGTPALEAQKELPNPFIFGNPVDEDSPGVFTGRQDIVGEIERNILGSGQIPVLLLQGPRRMGKTSILKQLPRLLGPDFAPAFADCQAPAFRETAPSALRSIARALSSALAQRRVSCTPITSEELERSPFSAFGAWLERTERAMPAALRLLLCLDEIERLGGLVDSGWGSELLDLLRHISQHHRRIVLLFAGAHGFSELGPAWTSRFVATRRIRVGLLQRHDAEELLTPPVEGFDATYAPDALAALLDATAGQPFLTQAVAFELVSILNEAQRRDAELADVQAALARALDSGEAYFGNLWSDAGESGRMVLTAIALRQPPPDATRAFLELEAQLVLTERHTFVVPLVERWVRERGHRLRNERTLAN